MALPSDGAPRLIVGSGVVLLCVAVWYVTLAPAALGGPLSLVLVRGTSMEPTYVTGDLVVGYRAGQLEPGDVAIFRGPGDSPVIHRIGAVDGERIVTRGDNLAVDDPWETGHADVLGTARLHLPGVGAGIGLLAQPLALGALAGVMVLSLVLWRAEASGPSGGETEDRDHGPPVPRMITAVVLGALCGAAALTVAGAASMAVTSDEVAAVTVAGPFDTYLLTPGGGGGNGGGNGGGGNGGGRP